MRSEVMTRITVCLLPYNIATTGVWTILLRVTQVVEDERRLTGLPIVKAQTPDTFRFPNHLFQPR